MKEKMRRGMEEAEGREGTQNEERSDGKGWKNKKMKRGDRMIGGRENKMTEIGDKERIRE